MSTHEERPILCTNIVRNVCFRGHAKCYVCMYVRMLLKISLMVRDDDIRRRITTRFATASGNFFFSSFFFATICFFFFLFFTTFSPLPLSRSSSHFNVEHRITVRHPIFTAHHVAIRIECLASSVTALLSLERKRKSQRSVGRQSVCQIVDDNIHRNISYTRGTKRKELDKRWK